MMSHVGTIGRLREWWYLLKWCMQFVVGDIASVGVERVLNIVVKRASRLSYASIVGKVPNEEIPKIQ